MSVIVKQAAPSLMSATSNYAWPLPTVHGDKDIWGDILNTQTFAGIDASLHNNNPATTGSIDNMVIGGAVPRAGTFASMVLNTPLPLGSGGTGATTAAGARSNLGVMAPGADAAYAWRTNNLSDLANITTARANLGLGTAATQAIGTSGTAVPLLDGANTWSATQNFSQWNIDANYRAYLSGGTLPILLFDSNDYLSYNRSSNAWNYVAASQTIAQIRDAGIVIEVIKPNNAETGCRVTNSSTGNAAMTGYRIESDASAAYMELCGSGYAASGIFQPNSLMLRATGVNGIVINPSNASAPIIFAPGGSERGRYTGAGELLLGTTTDNGAYLLQVNSQIFATNATIATSDARIKRQLPDLTEEQWDKIAAIPIRIYERTDRPDDGSRAGYYAQDWQAILGLDTGIVRQPAEGAMLQLDEGAAHALKIAALEHRIADLEARLERAGA